MSESEEDSDDLEDLEINARPSELLAFQKELKQEKEFLEKLLTKIDDQVNRLQVEQLHLLGLVNKSIKTTSDEPEPQQSTNDEQQPSTSKSLDLSVASALKYLEEEFEDEDEDDI